MKREVVRMTDENTINSKYLYAIIKCREQREFIARGIGERGDAVHTIAYKGLAAVVSDSPVMEYDQSRRNMMAHTAVLEELMEEFTLLPVRFNTVAPEAGAIEERLLVPRHEEFTQLLGQIDKRVELGIKAFWHDGMIFEEVLRENDSIRKMRDALEGKSVDGSYYERIQLGEKIEQAMIKKRVEDEEIILSRIRQHVHKSRSNKTIGDRMVLNGAFLVDANKESDFDKAVQLLDQDLGNRLMFKYVGPVPPYNFVNIVVNWGVV
ncbi:GvpL/GvpF-family gas vesicle protein 1 [Octadecabacter antarcticus 307]|uniref:GvpL/GvpF-family gas vesicle protein 1 n=1 Tax=Octadecabacter antarcticus 307 TaxID=391626 RepID=M9RFI5_9RHOB|nr:GvpL/GvpF family gas vesicle protein [Octadecabacter antarcticus]AGI68580.1 GvpL/GvpF-family gas vesicle protein 1 [Octadecabacter antarcticus 307]